jgi:hypothetical protein
MPLNPATASSTDTVPYCEAAEALPMLYQIDISLLHPYFHSAQWLSAFVVRLSGGCCIEPDP